MIARLWRRARPASAPESCWTGLDPTSRLRMWDVIRSLVADGTTLLVTTQYLEEAYELADRIVVVDHGRAIAAGDDPNRPIVG
jgi:ABC-type multidrug transport system ATPase subunit